MLAPGRLLLLADPASCLTIFSSSLIIGVIKVERSSAFVRIERRVSASSAGGAKPRRSALVIAPRRTAASRVALSAATGSAASPDRSRARRRRSRPYVLGEKGPNVPGIALQLTVGERAFLERPEASDAIVRLAEHALAEQSDRDEQQGGPQERDEQLRRDLGRKAADGADERIVASAQRPPALGDGRAPRPAPASDKDSGGQCGRSRNEVGDQPASVDPRNVQICDRGQRQLLAVVVDVVALEVQGAPVAGERDLELVRGVVRDPVRTGMNAAEFSSQNLRISSMPVAVCPGPTVRVAFGAHRLSIRSMSFVVVASWKSFSIWSISHMSALRCWACSVAELVPELVHAARQTTRTPIAQPIMSFRI